MSNRAHWKDLLPVITAYANGKEIECEVSPGVWVPVGSDGDECDDVDFCGIPSAYRIAPLKLKRGARYHHQNRGPCTLVDWTTSGGDYLVFFDGPDNVESKNRLRWLPPDVLTELPS